MDEQENVAVTPQKTEEVATETVAETEETTEETEQA